MPDAPPTSPLITPDLRRQLQQRYEEAQRLSAAASPNFRRIHGLLAACVSADPGNVLYLDALFANLRRWAPKPSWLASILPRWLGRKARPAAGDSYSVPSTQHSIPGTQYAILQSASQQLLARPRDGVHFRELAMAAGSCDFDEVELRYWGLAIAAAPTDPANLRGLAQALSRQGRFEPAIAAWQNLLNALPNDTEATAALTDLESAAERQYSDRERCLADAQAAGGPLLAILVQREDLQLARARHRLEVARRLAVRDEHPKAATLVERLAAELDRLEIEILHLRCERLPRDWQVRLELARRLKQARNYSGAIQRLEEAERLQPDDPAVLIEQGECWQHLRQFAKALGYYSRAAELPGDDKKLALYRAGVLSAAMGQPAVARQYLETLVATAPDFLDARQRLDNLKGS